jgi:integrase
VLHHSFGTYCLQRGMNPIQVAEIMGHSSLAMITHVYAHLTPQDAHVAMMKALLQDDDKRR